MNGPSRHRDLVHNHKILNFIKEDWSYLYSTDPYNNIQDARGIQSVFRGK